MKPELHVRRRESLPRLAWCARLDVAGRRVDLTCGPWVDTGPDWFFEGAWAGEFGAADFQRASERFGSGGRLVEGGLLLTPTSHTLDRLYLVRRPEAVLSSNSLAFLLESAGLELDVRYPHYVRDFWSVIMGSRRCARRIPT
ncbi:MAG: hypothetical protein JRI25_20565, partial [Deltaproteobacteria bacterium]|nr:hypothetical protein [Deltaproteobacteria bacterium]